MIEPREQLQEQRQRLYAQRGEDIAVTVLRVAEIELHMLDQKLRRCSRDEMEKIQGEVAAWLRLQKYIQQSPDLPA